MADPGSRALRTRDKMMRGGLPYPVAVPASIGTGAGGPCRGCGEAITPHEKLYSIQLLDALTMEFDAECYQNWQLVQALSFDFHAECYESWSSFKAREANAP
jgi:hypothetical protein